MTAGDLDFLVTLATGDLACRTIELVVIGVTLVAVICSLMLNLRAQRTLGEAQAELERARRWRRSILAVRFGPVRFRHKTGEAMLKGPSNVNWVIPLEFDESVDKRNTPTFSSSNSAVGEVLSVTRIIDEANPDEAKKWEVLFSPNGIGSVRINGRADVDTGDGFEALEFSEDIEVQHPKAKSARFGELRFVPKETPQAVPASTDTPAAETPPAASAVPPAGGADDGDEQPAAITTEAALQNTGTD